MCGWVQALRVKSQVLVLYYLDDVIQCALVLFTSFKQDYMIKMKEKILEYLID